METYEIKNLTFTYPESETAAIKDVSLKIHDGDFFVLCGCSGSGKTTLLRRLKPVLAPHGTVNGELLFNGSPLDKLDERTAASEIGFVLQSPDNQIVTDKVWHELAFGLESIGLDTPAIRRRVSETASFFGIENWFYKSVSELSGGQKQLLNLASVMIMQPRVLILDEPTGQLDPIAASDFLSMLKKINSELGITVILSEHRLEEALSMANRAAVMENGRLICTGTVPEIGAYLKEHGNRMFGAMPSAMRIWSSVQTDFPCPVTSRDGRLFLEKYAKNRSVMPIPANKPASTGKDVSITASDVWFRYEKNQPDVVKGLSLTVAGGELFCLLGGNGAGKSTALRLIAGLKKPYRGEISTKGRVCLLPQNPQTLFVTKSVYEELSDAVSHIKYTREETGALLAPVIRLCRLETLVARHPYDLSGGEQQRLALAKLLLLRPDTLLLDEPTKGMDAGFKTEFAGILKQLLNSGICILMVSHDIEFCAEYADRCALFFDGAVTASGAPGEFFSGNSFYTTSANRMSRNIIPGAVTVKDVITAIGGEAAAIPVNTDACQYAPVVPPDEKPERRGKLPLWRKAGAAVSGTGALAVLLYTARHENLSDFIGKSGVTAKGMAQLPVYAALILCLLLLALFVGRRSKPPLKVQTLIDKRRLTKRTAFSVALILLLIPVTLFIGVVYIGQKQYYLTALTVMLECMLPFFMVFEGRHPKPRELVIIAVLCAIGVAGRAAFFMLPQFKPVLALTVVAGVAFGGETGFLVGAVTMLVSNIMFSQGPWTPWQMFAMGIIGFLAGILFRKGWLRRSRVSLCIFGAVSTIVIYGGIMNPASALIWGGGSLNAGMLMGYYITGFPMDCVHAAATVFFLWFAAEPMLEKLDRVKVKYGLVE